MKSALTTLALQIGMIWLYCAWQINGSEGAGNMLVFFAWVIAALTIFCGCFCKPETFRNLPKDPMIFNLEKKAFNLAVIGGMVWAGHTVLATFYMLGWFLIIMRKEVSKEGV